MPVPKTATTEATKWELRAVASIAAFDPWTVRSNPAAHSCCHVLRTLGRGSLHPCSDALKVLPRETAQTLHYPLGLLLRLVFKWRYTYIFTFDYLLRVAKLFEGLWRLAAALRSINAYERCPEPEHFSHRRPDILLHPMYSALI